MTKADAFILAHPIGNAVYDDYLCVPQNVTVNTPDSCDVILGKGIILSAGVKIIGDSTIGNRVVIGASVTLNNTEIPNDSIVYNDRTTGKLIIRNYDTTPFLQKYFRGGCKTLIQWQGVA